MFQSSFVRISLYLNEQNTCQRCSKEQVSSLTKQHLPKRFQKKSWLQRKSFFFVICFTPRLFYKGFGEWKQNSFLAKQQNKTKVSFVLLPTCAFYETLLRWKTFGLESENCMIPRFWQHSFVVGIIEYHDSTLKWNHTILWFHAWCVLNSVMESWNHGI